MVLSGAYDVIVVGGGNAGLCASIAAADSGKKVLLLERGTRIFRGGNSKYTRDIRCGRNDHTPVGDYTEVEFMDDVLRVTGGITNMELAKLTIQRSFSMPRWMEKQGVKWQPALKGTLSLSRTNWFFIGGGKALVNNYYASAEKKGVKVLYESTVDELVFDGDTVTGVSAEVAGERQTFQSKAVIAAAGGFEANLAWLKEYWGAAADNFIIRGTRYNDGTLLKLLMKHGARTIGTPNQFHAIAVDARSPNYDAGIITRVDSVPFSIILNKRLQRFYDEGEDLWPKRYAIWGKLIAEQPDQIAYSIFDRRSLGKFLPTWSPPYSSETLSGLAQKVGLDGPGLEATVKAYNERVVAGTYDTTKLDDCRTEGLDPPKTHWAVKISEPPFFAYPLRPGVTFTYLGVAIDRTARILKEDGQSFPNLFASGELMAGNILSKGYLAGFGLTIGTTFGLIAGEEAAKDA